MSRKPFTTTLGLCALVILASTTFIPTSSASPGASTAMRNKPAGLTLQGIENARQAGLPSHLVTMAPQSSMKVLSRATELGAHSAKAKIELTVGLKLRNETRLKSFLQQVQNPASPEYHQWLTPKEFTARYGPSKAQVAQVVQYLKARGITVKNVSPNRLLIHTEATTATYDAAFGVQINDYKLNGRSFYSTTDRPKLPRRIAPLVSNILGLNHGVQMQPHSFFEQPSGVVAEGLSPNVARPPASLTNLNPLQIANAYNWPDITEAPNGAGASIAILTAVSSGLGASGLPHIFWGVFGLPDHTINVIPVDGDYGNTAGMGETLLDIEMSGAMGPGATFNVYVAADRYGATFIDMYNQFVNDNTSAVMTTSWGHPEAGAIDVTSNEIFMQAAAQGISMFAAAGDHGSGDGTGLSNFADFPSSSPYVTAANGTQLTIADRSGAYGSEIVWNDAAGCGLSTGGAISRLFEKPVWQRGPGVPADVGMRMNSGIALTASCSHPMYILVDGGLVLASGTSAVAPQLAGLFAIAVSRNGGDRLGQSNTLIYNDANVNYASDFHDVTSGNNGAFEAGPGWDHPTGWGSVNAMNLLSHIVISGAKGTLNGTVTDAANGQPVVGATIKVGDLKIVSAEDGSYSTVLPAGHYAATVTAVGYQQTSATVNINDGDTVTQDFALAAAAKVVLSGKVTDGSGHGYGLYADIKVVSANFRQVAEVWTNPQTGRYSVKLPKGADYTIKVAAALNGYNTASKIVTLSGDKTQDFALTVTDTCSTPGYAFSGVGGFSEDFNKGIFPPTGWLVMSGPPNREGAWTLSSDTGIQDNYTGGTGDAATADSDFVGSNTGFVTSLVTPPISVTSLSGMILRYKANYWTYMPGSGLGLGITTDGGAHWSNILHWDANHGTTFDLPGYNVKVNLAPYLPNSGNFQLRWFYHVPGWDGYAQIDDVVIGSCAPLPGGLIVGQVTDHNTDQGIVGAHVEDDQGVGAGTVANPTDQNPDHPSPLYEFFASAGTRTLTVTASNYSTATAQVQVSNNQVVRKDFTLKAAQLEVTSTGLTLEVPVGNSATASFALKSTGAGTASFRIFPIDSPLPVSSEKRAVVNVPVAHPAWMKASLPWIQAQAKALGKPFAATPKPGNVSPRTGDAGGPWIGIAPYPIMITDNAAARNPATGKVYSVDGYAKLFGEFQLIYKAVNLAYVFDPESPDAGWLPIADAPIARDGPVSAFVDGKLYVFNGWDDTTAARPAVAEVDIYNPATNTWSQGTPNPAPAGGGSAVAVLNGLVYIVGGCTAGPNCSASVSSVQVYNPVSNEWSPAADYPTPAAWAACGAINGKLYCAGGENGTVVMNAGYVYNPVLNNWSPIANMPASLFGSYYTAANGLLLMAGGLTSGGIGSSITNRTVAYDPSLDTWMNLPALPQPVMRGGSACGFYGIGGILHPFQNGNTFYTANSEVLPGYDRCGGTSPLPWLTVAPTQGTLDAGASATITLSFDGTGREAFTTSSIYLSIVNNTPYGLLTVPITVHWEPQPVDLALTGSASPSPVRKGGNLVYTLSVENQQAQGHGAATGAMLTYKMPDGISYVTAGGDASCTAPSTGSSPAPAAATGGQSGTVTCDFGTLEQGATKTVTIAVKADQAGTLASHFEVAAREPNDSGKSALDLSTTVIGNADMGVSLADASLKKNQQATVPVMVSNAGPDTATDVKLKLTAGAVIAINGGSADQGGCTASGSNGYECDLGDVASGQSVTVEFTITGQEKGTASLTAQVATSAEDPGELNNVATASVTVKDNGGGGGALGWLALVALLGLTLTGAAMRRRGG